MSELTSPHYLRLEFGQSVAAVLIYERLLAKYNSERVHIEDSFLLEICWAYVHADEKSASIKMSRVPTPIPQKIFVEVEFVKPSLLIHFPSEILMGMWNMNIHGRNVFGKAGKHPAVLFSEPIQGKRVFFLYYGGTE